MNYQEALKYINQITTEKGMIFDIETVKELLNRVGNPEEKLNIIHIAGTNGKGSVGTFLACILECAGYKVGRFYSPALFTYREVISVIENGNLRFISQDEVARYITLIAGIREQMIQDGYRGLTSFEMETAMAFMFMAEQECNPCLVECGLGGELDSTNAVDKKLIEIITSIGIDHSTILGDSLELITKQKCGIIRDNTRVVTCNQDKEVLETIKIYCRMHNAKMCIADMNNCRIKEDSLHGIIFDDIKHNIEGIRLNMLGKHQITNANLAIEAIYNLLDLGFDISEDNIKDGLCRAHFKGRLDVVCSNPLIIADGAHNPHAAYKLKENIDNYFHGFNIIYVMSVFKDKDYKGIIDILKDDNSCFISCMTNNKRSLDRTELFKCAKDRFRNAYCEENVYEALNKAIELYGSNKDKSVIVCCGSLSIMKDIYKYVNELRDDNTTRIDKLMSNAIFQDCMKTINFYEKNRIFCKHDINHLLDVARITWIYCLENDTNITKEIVYCAALLHDIGRARQYVDGTNHEEAGVILSKEIMKECGFNNDEVNLVVSAISAHNNDNWSLRDKKAGALVNYLQKADNISRNCFLCEAKEQCKWPVDKKNYKITY